MYEFKIKVDLSEVMDARGIITAKIFPLLNLAVRAVTEQTSIDWAESVERAKLWRGEKDSYKTTIQWKMISDFEALVWADYKYAEEIELGRPQKDLKRMLNTSLKVRVSKKGSRYLIIPFQHNVPSADAVGRAMPSDIYKIAQNLTSSSIIGHTQRLSGTGAYDIQSRKRLTVNQNTYNWGESLNSGESEHKNYEGMRRFNTSGGGTRRSTYLTFRVMSENSRGWIVPAKPGLFLAKAVAEAMQPKAESAFQEAIRRTK